MIAGKLKYKCRNCGKLHYVAVQDIEIATFSVCANSRYESNVDGMYPGLTLKHECALRESGLSDFIGSEHGQ